ncbi:cuticle protein-like [Galleria mellonella]|uniref:Cuticle protein-like n=1 Tax=Galleria mellonella TaxID=7137 RepID=A0A6J3C3U9_GALME|nr:cuticle protein-like [Galleria mellonella]
MKLFAIACLLVLTGSTKADGSLGGLVYAPGHASVDYYAYPRYAFEYAVKDPHTGDNKAQWEKRDGDVVKGAYSLVEPDGSLRVVEYWADDKSGFNAVVKRLGPNLHPVAPVTPIYKAPIPVLRSEPVVAPIAIGSVAKYGGLASAPLITGPLGGVATSSAILHKPSVPILSGPVLPTPIVPNVPIVPTPILPSPIIKSAPIVPAPILSTPIIKSSPYLSAPLSEPYLSPLSTPINAWGPRLLKAPGLGLGPTLTGLGSWGAGNLDLDYIGSKY